MKPWMVLVVSSARIASASKVRCPRSMKCRTVSKVGSSSDIQISVARLCRKWIATGRSTSDAHGRLCTSSPLTSNWRRDEYFLIGDQKRKVKMVGLFIRG